MTWKDKLRVAIVGYGNLGKYALEAVETQKDMEAAGVVLLKAGEGECIGQIPVVDDVRKLGHIDAALLCVPTLTVEKVAGDYLRQGIATIDSYDIHGKSLWEMKNKLDVIAKEGGTVAVTAAGWDPGIDSLIRAAFCIAVPVGLTYTNYGPGMSLGHSVAARSAAGVEDAVSLTYPLGSGRHRRLVYAKLAAGVKAEEVHNTIAQMDYFAKDELVFNVVDDLEAVRDYGHGVLIERKGIAGQTHNQRLSCTFNIHNPAITGQIMVMAARAARRRLPGAYTMLEIPPSDYFADSLEELIQSLV